MEKIGARRVVTLLLLSYLTSSTAALPEVIKLGQYSMCTCVHQHIQALLLLAQITSRTDHLPNVISLRSYIQTLLLHMTLKTATLNEVIKLGGSTVIHSPPRFIDLMNRSSTVLILSKYTSLFAVEH